MARICFEITPDELAPTVYETFAKAHGWRSTQLDGPAGAFAMARLIDGLYQVVEGQWGEQAAAAARADAVAQVRSNITIQPAEPDTVRAEGKR